MPGPAVPRGPGAISSDRARWHPAGTGFRDWNSTGRTRVLPPVGALVSPGPDHCLHGIPSGWSHDAPFAVRRPAHRLRHALESTRSGGAVMPGPVFRRPRFSCCVCPRGRPRGRLALGSRRPGRTVAGHMSHRRLGPLSRQVTYGGQAFSPGPRLQVNSGRSCSLFAVVPGPLASAGAL